MKNNALKRRIVLLSLCTLIITIVFSVQVSAKTEFDCENGKHQYSVQIIKQKTADEDGEVKYTCDLCGYTYSEVLPATGHKWNNWVVDKEATCGAQGHEYRTCEKCNRIQEQLIPALGTGHTFTSSVTKEPTANQTGIKTYKCSVCGYTYTEVLPMIAVEQTTEENSTEPETTERNKEADVVIISNNNGPETLQGKIRINTLDVVLPTTTFIYSAIVASLLWFNWLVIGWDRKKRKENKEKRKQGDHQELD